VAHGGGVPTTNDFNNDTFVTVVSALNSQLAIVFLYTTLTPGISYDFYAMIAADVSGVISWGGNGIQFMVEDAV
jgi:hypothetical protein